MHTLSRFLLAVSVPWIAAVGQSQLPVAGQVAATARGHGVFAEGPAYVHAHGPRYRAHFEAHGMRFEPALGSRAPSLQHLELRPIAVRSGGTTVAAGGAAPRLVGEQVRYEHAAGIVERYDVQDGGVALSWRFDEPLPNGELVVRYAVDTSLPAPVGTEGGGLVFADPVWGGVQIAGVTGIDAGGATVAGELRYDRSVVELALPAEFVANARYPIVLDPLIGTVTNIAGINTFDHEPDVAFDATTQLLGVAFVRVFSSNNAIVYLQRMDTNGAHTGALTPVSGSGAASRVRIANLPQYDRFGIVWKEGGGLNESLRFAAVGAGSGLVTHSGTLATVLGAAVLQSPDIAGDMGAGPGTGRGFLVTYDHNGAGQIRSHVVSFDPTDTLQIGPANTVLSDTGGIGSTYSEPALPRMAAQDGLLLLAARRYNGIGPTKSVRIVAVDVTTGLPIPGTTASFPGTQNGDCTVPDVDGISGNWIVVWQQTASAGGYPSVQRATVGVNHGTGGLLLGTAIGFGGVQLAQAAGPRIAWTPGRAWLAYRYLGGFPTATNTVRSIAIDSATLATCGDQFVRTVLGSDKDIAVATGTSGGQTGGESAYCVFEDALSIYGQGLINYGTNGSVTNIGGGCGVTGAVSVSHAPGIGSSGLRCELNQMPPTALVSVFNFAVPSAPLACGNCQWQPFSVTQTLPLLGGSASVEFPIPCLTALIGSSFVTQWTTLDPTSSPCPSAPSISLSDRLELVIGN